MSETSTNTLKKQKKIIISIIISMVVFIAAYYVIASIDWSALFDKSGDKNGTGNDTIYFYDEKLSTNIFQDEQYMALDRSINFSKNNWTSTIDDESAVREGPAVNLIYNMLGYILSGNNEAYNSCFSSEYYKQAKPMGRFTQQKIYNIVITEISVNNNAVDENGVQYVQYFYKLEYMIRHNNGSLRNDMGSDCIRAQYLVLSERFSNEVLIDNMYTLTSQ